MKIYAGDGTRGILRSRNGQVHRTLTSQQAELPLSERVHHTLHYLVQIPTALRLQLPRSKKIFTKTYSITHYHITLLVEAGGELTKVEGEVMN